MPERVHSRRQFERLAKPSRRGRSGPFRVLFAEPSESPEEFGVAYAIHRSVGNAVTRNRIRRRLRAVLDELRSDMTPGLYLIKCDFSAKDLAYDQLQHHIQHALREANTLH